jgi:hypothetical protein
MEYGPTGTRNLSPAVISLVVLAVVTLGLVIGSFVYTAVSVSKAKNIASSYTPEWLIQYQYLVNTKNLTITALPNQPQLVSMSWTLPERPQLPLVLAVNMYNSNTKTRVGGFPFTTKGTVITVAIPLGEVVSVVGGNYVVSPNYQAVVVYRPLAGVTP